MGSTPSQPRLASPGKDEDSQAPSFFSRAANYHHHPPKSTLGFTLPPRPVSRALGQVRHRPQPEVTSEGTMTLKAPMLAQDCQSILLPTGLPPLSTLSGEAMDPLPTFPPPPLVPTTSSLSDLRCLCL